MTHCRNRANRLPDTLFLGRGITMFFIIVVMPFVSLAQTTNGTTLPPEAQAAVKKGIIAAKQQDYLLAVRYFQDARKIAPAAPEIFFNLGLAESKIPSRELRAIAWFGAYLAATTNAPKAAAVKDQIDALDVKSQINISRLIQTAQKITDQAHFRNPWLKILNQAELTKDQAKAGDIAGAKKAFASELKIAKNIQNTPNFEPSALERGKGFALAAIAQSEEEVAIAQAKAENISGSQMTFKSAREVVDLIQDSTLVKEIELARIARNQMISGDIAGALKTADSIQDPNQKSWALELLPEAQANIGLTTAKPVLSDWLNKLDNGDYDCALNTDPFLDLSGYLTANKSDDPQTTSDNLTDIAGKIVEAQNVIDRMLKHLAKQQAQP